MPSRDMAFQRRAETQVLGTAHAMASDRASHLHKVLGIPVVVLTIIVGTAAFSTLTDIGKSNPIIAIAAGLLSVTAAVLSGLQTFLDFNARAEAHKVAADKLNDVVLKLDHAISDDKFDSLVKIDEDYSKIKSESPRVPIALQEAARRYLDGANPKPADQKPESPVSGDDKASPDPSRSGVGGGSGGFLPGTGKLWAPQDLNRG